jgi:1-deoxy-D-xylulose-5-phosphate reductoisomerase
LPLAYYAIEKGGNLPCILNAANEVAVDAFLQRKLNYLRIADIIENTMRKANFTQNISLDNFVHSNDEARKIATEFVLLCGKNKKTLSVVNF